MLLSGTWLAPLAIVFLFGCASTITGYDPSRKIEAEKLREDFDIMRHLMEKFHPSLYWYTPKESMDACFERYRSAITDSMTEQQFGFRILAPSITPIRCGHTSFSFSKRYNRFFRDLSLPSFPLYLKIWGDTMIVIRNLDKNDSVIIKGTQITRINGMDARALQDTMFPYMPTDGYSTNINNIRLSSAFPYYHRNIFGLQKSYPVSYLDSSGQEKNTILPVFRPKDDSSLQARKPAPGEAAWKKEKKTTRKERLEMFRSLSFDSSRSSAIMTINSFDDGGNLFAFYRRSFHQISRRGIRNLVIDIRSNGGGKVNNYTQLARYLMNKGFKVADSAYAVRNSFGKDGPFFTGHFLNGIGLAFLTSRKGDSLYHFRWWENKEFLPKKKDHFNGKVFVLVNGPTFSASTLFCHTVHDQGNIKLIGEETGGGHYGNNGLMIPNITLPNTGIRVRMPLFRIIQYNHPSKDGRGIMPDYPVGPHADAVRKGIDLKMQKANELIDAGYLYE
jgi:hypothetical protein